MNPLTLQDRAQLAAHARIQTDRITGQTVLLFPEGILKLNETSSAILERCDGRTISEAIADLAQHYEVPDSELQADVLEFLEDLQRRQLLRLS
ncbi:MAG TPA: pyrroloquinoline quinone biosynthesis peptide chaperone PqqD [Chthoniobacter sp.]|nr:pyrroloquinoline quinone biosynthesis peptide chaperone PqqD [Chthoniobacter sp.]